MAATTPENKVKGQIKKWLLSLPGCWFYSATAGPWSVGGIPDLIGVINGRFFAIEVKGPGRVNSATPLQKMRIAQIKGAGGVAFIADSLETVQTMFAEEKLA